MSHPLLRTLISEMVESYLEESYEDDLVESIFEEVSEETWEAIEEAILNELSPTTLKSYMKKAGASKDKNIKLRDANREKESEAKKNREMWYNKSISARYRTPQEGKGRVYPWDTQTGAYSRANASGRKEAEYGRKADKADKNITKREKGISQAASRI